LRQAEHKRPRVPRLAACDSSAWHFERKSGREARRLVRRRRRRAGRGRRRHRRREWPLAVEVASVTRGPAIEAVYATGIVEPA
jgi:hypothetical protein